MNPEQPQNPTNLFVGVCQISKHLPGAEVLTMAKRTTGYVGAAFGSILNGTFLQRR
jgi:hypothetical protein